MLPVVFGWRIKRAVHALRSLLVSCGVVLLFGSMRLLRAKVASVRFHETTVLITFNKQENIQNDLESCVCAVCDCKLVTKGKCVLQSRQAVLVTSCFDYLLFLSFHFQYPAACCLGPAKRRALLDVERGVP